MISLLPPVRRALAAGASFLAVVMADGALGAARAQSKLQAHYIASLAGIPLGKGTWLVEFADNQYIASASGSTTGLVKVFTGGHGSGSVRGTMAGGNFVPASYSAMLATDRRTEEVRLTLGGGNVKEVERIPEKPVPPKSVPLTEAHRKNVIDPMTGTFVYVPGTGDPLVPQSCNRNLAVFDGHMRYDLDFAYKRMDKVKSEKGYVGPALVCSVYFSPVAGHVPSRAAIKYLIRQRDMEVWLIPVAGTRMLAPYRFSVPTPLGLGVLQANEFVVSSLPKAGAKSQ